MHALLIPAYQVVPLWQWLPECCQPVTAGNRKPVKLHHIFRCDLYTIWHILLSVGVIGATVCLKAQVAASDIGKGNHPCIYILCADLAAQAAAIAQRFPFLGC